MNKSREASRILVINYYWPPSGGPAVQRWLKLTQLLADRGFEPHVLTVDEHYATYPFIDESLNEQVDQRVVVHKTRTRELFWLYRKTIGRGAVPGSAFANESNPGPLKKLSRFVRGNFFIPDPRKGWNAYAIAKGSELIEAYQIPTIVTAGPPHSSHLIGKALKQQHAVQWMIDFHDYWTDVSYYDMFYRLPCSRKRDARLEKEVIAECDQAITHCRSSRRILAEKTAVPSHEKVNVITMAYDEQLLSRPSEPPQDRLAITYTGTIADFYEPAVLFRALGRLMRKYPQAPVEVRLVGVVGEQVQQLVQEEGLTEVVTETGYVPRRTAVDYLMTSSAIVMINPYFKNERYHVPGKIYEYLASHKPILNIAPTDGETAEIIRECGAGQTFERHMEEELLAYLEGLYSQWQANPDLDVKGNEACVRQFAYNQEGDKLARILRGMQARDPALTASS